MSGGTGVFCLEGEWGDLNDRSTVEPILELLTKVYGPRLRYVHRNVGTRVAFIDYLKKWTQRKFDAYPVLYLAFHGGRGEIYVGESKRSKDVVTLRDLADLLEGKCKRRIIFLGSCETVDVHGKRLSTFLRRTGALAVCGYCGSVNWVISTAFELVVLASIQENALTISGAGAIHKKIIARARSTAKSLSFRMVVRHR